MSDTPPILSPAPPRADPSMGPSCPLRLTASSFLPQVKALVEFLIDNCFQIFGENIPAPPSLPSDDTDGSGTGCTGVGRGGGQAVAPASKGKDVWYLELRDLHKSPGDRQEPVKNHEAGRPGWGISSDACRRRQSRTFSPPHAKSQTQQALSHTLQLQGCGEKIEFPQIARQPSGLTISKSKFNTILVQYYSPPPFILPSLYFLTFVII